MDNLGRRDSSFEMLTMGSFNSSWRPVRPVVVPFPLFRHLYFNETSCAHARILYSYPEPGSNQWLSQSSIGRQNPQSAFSEICMEKTALSSDESCDNTNPDESLRNHDSSFDDASFLPSSPFSSSRISPDNHRLDSNTNIAQAYDDHCHQPHPTMEDQRHDLISNYWLCTAPIYSSPSSDKLPPMSSWIWQRPPVSSAEHSDFGVEITDSEMGKFGQERELNQTPKLRQPIAKEQSVSPDTSVAPSLGGSHGDDLLVPPHSTHHSRDMLLAMMRPIETVSTENEPFLDSTRRKHGNEHSPTKVTLPVRDRKRTKRKVDSIGSCGQKSENDIPSKKMTKLQAHVCDTCGRSFQYPRSLTTHQLVHQNIRPHKCTFPLCSKSFRQTGHLQTHLLIHTGEKPFRCPIDGCTTQAFRHANRRCPVHSNLRLRKTSSVSTEKPLDLSHQVLSDQPNVRFSSGYFQPIPETFNHSEAAMALLQLAGTAVPSTCHPQR